ncbi:MAG: acyltransferase family protein [Actinomycetota bacterium]
MEPTPTSVAPDAAPRATIAGRHRHLPYRPALDGLRAVAVLAVVLYHFDPEVVTGGLLGVSVFFTLSGFLIVTLLLRERETTGSVDLGAFWARRIRRLAPAALVTTTVVILLAGGGAWGWRNAMVWTDPVAAAWSVMNWHQIGYGPGVGLRIVHPLSPYWSLAVEEQFYLVVGIVLLGVRRVARPAVVMLWVTGAVWIVGAGVARFADLSPTMAEWGTQVRAPEIAAGCVLACTLIVTGREVRGRTADLVGWAAFAGLVALFAFASKSQWWLFHGGFALVSIVSTGVLVGLLADGSLARVLAWRPLVALGTISYALYLVHWPVRLALVPERTGGLDGAPLTLVRLGVALALAVALHLTVERPFMRGFPARPPVVLATWLLASAAVTLLAYGLLA